MSVSFLTLINLFNFTSEVFAQNWKIERDGFNNLNFYLGTNLSSLQLKNGSGAEAKIRKIYDLDDATNIFLLDPNGSSKLNNLDLTGSLTQNGLPIGGGGQWTTSGNNISNSNTGNVGIGTTTPNALLDVNGTTILGSSTQGGLRVVSLDSNSVNLRPSIGNGDILISDDSGQAARGITIANGGNLGIGTAAPSQKLEVAGNMYLSSAGATIYFPFMDNHAGYMGFSSAGEPIMSDGVPYYFGIGRDPGAWNYPYPDLVVNNHTGVKLVAHGNYGGVAIYEELNTAGTAWSATGNEVARFRDDRWGGSYVNGIFRINESGNPIQFNSNHTGFVNGGNNKAEIANDTGSYKTLMILGNKSADSSTRKVSIWDRLEVNGTLFVSDKLDANGNIKTSSGDFIDPAMNAPGNNAQCFTNAGVMGNCSSDRRLKENIQYLIGKRAGLDIVDRLKPATFDYLDGRKNASGFIAQDALDIIPGSVKMEKSGYYSMDYRDVTPYTVKAIQELKAENDELNNKVEAQQKQIETLQEQIKELQSQLNSLKK